jgi:hypothetical protein
MSNLEPGLITDDKALRAVLDMAARGDAGHLESQQILVSQEGAEACRN